MKTMKKMLSCWSAGMFGLLLAGCGTDPAVSLGCVMPAKAVSDPAAVDLMEISAEVHLSGSAIPAGADTSYAAGILCERTAAGFCREGFCRTTDLIWGNETGTSGLESYIRLRNPQHGYARIVTDSGMERARLFIRLDLTIDTGCRQTFTVTPTHTDLFRIAYRDEKIYWGYGEHARSGYTRVPYAEKVRTFRQDVRTDYYQYWAAASGRLSFQLTDKKGKTVYSRTFDDLRFSAQNTPESHIAIPTNAQIVSVMTRKAIESVIRDLSPYRENVKVKINKDGDSRGFLLLESLAFVEAIEAYEKKPEEDRSFAEWENLGVAYEAVGEPVTARGCYEKALELKRRGKGIFDYDRGIAESGLDRVEKVISADRSLRARNVKKVRPQYRNSEIKR